MNTTVSINSFDTCFQKNFDSEVEAFQRHLEKVYRLCPTCEVKVTQEIETQNEAICMRLSHLDESQRSLLGISSYPEEKTFLVYICVHYFKCPTMFRKLIFLYFVYIY